MKEPEAMVQGTDDEANLRVIEGVNSSRCTMGVIGRSLSPDEAALGLNQTTIASDVAGNPVVLITKGERSANLTRFLYFALSKEGQAILAKEGFVPA